MALSASNFRRLLDTARASSSLRRERDRTMAPRRFLPAPTPRRRDGHQGQFVKAQRTIPPIPERKEDNPRARAGDSQRVGAKRPATAVRSSRLAIALRPRPRRGKRRLGRMFVVVSHPHSSPQWACVYDGRVCSVGMFKIVALAIGRRRRRLYFRFHERDFRSVIAIILPNCCLSPSSKMAMTWWSSMCT